MKKKEKLEKQTDRVFERLIKLTFDYMMVRQQFLWLNNCEHCQRLAPSLTPDYKRTEKTFEWLRGCSRSVTVIKFLQRYLASIIKNLREMSSPDFDFDPRIFEILELAVRAFLGLHRDVERPFIDPDQP